MTLALQSSDTSFDSLLKTSCLGRVGNICLFMVGLILLGFPGRHSANTDCFASSFLTFIVWATSTTHLSFPSTVYSSFAQRRRPVHLVYPTMPLQQC